MIFFKWKEKEKNCESQQQHVSGEANMLISKTTLNNVIHVVGERLGALASPIQFVMAFLFSVYLHMQRCALALKKNANYRVQWVSALQPACVNAMRVHHIKAHSVLLGSMEPPIAQSSFGKQMHIVWAMAMPPYSISLSRQSIDQPDPSGLYFY